MPEWLGTFLGDTVLYGPFYAIANSIWNVLMSACTGLLTATPQSFSAETWEYVTETLYPWALAIGVSALNVFFIIGFCRAVSNFKENVTMELLIETLVKAVVLNLLLVFGMELFTTFFQLSSVMAGSVFQLNTPQLFTTDADSGARLFWFIFGMGYFLVALVCGILILITIYSRYIKLYALIVFYPLAMPALVGGRGVENTAYAWVRSFLSNVFEVVAIALVMGIAGRIVGGISLFTSENIVIEHFDGFAQALNSLVYMILMTVSVKGAAAFMNKTFNL